MGYLQVFPLSWLLAQCHMAGDPQSIKFGPGEVEQSEGEVIRKQENRAGWMEVLIRPTSRDIWLVQQKKKTDWSQKQFIFPSDFPLESVQTNHKDLRASGSKWGVGLFPSSFCPSHSVFLFSFISCWHFWHFLDVCPVSNVWIQYFHWRGTFHVRDCIRSNCMRLLWYVSQHCNAKQMWTNCVIQYVNM